MCADMLLARRSETSILIIIHIHRERLSAYHVWNKRSQVSVLDNSQYAMTKFV